MKSPTVAVRQAIDRPVLDDDCGWVTFPIRIGTTDDSAVLASSPGVYRLVAIDNDESVVIGALKIDLLHGPAPGPEFAAALRANPEALKTVRLSVGCKSCGDALIVYAAGERNPDLERSGHVWFEDIGDTFRCRCSATVVDLTHLKGRLHLALFLRGGQGQISFERLYETSALREIWRSYRELILEESCLEEPVQRFLKANPVVLQKFSPSWLTFKPRILGKYEADIALINERRELLLIELERPSLRLSLKTGGVSAGLVHAIDQVRDWLIEADDHRAALLDGLGLCNEDATRIRGAVVAGRASDLNKMQLKKLRRSDFGRVEFYTCDDLADALDSLILSTSSA